MEKSSCKYRYPFTPYPNGWYRVSLSKDLKEGQLKALKYFGKNLALFRGQDGVARLLDAHCPHLGAHLAVEGKVVGNNIKCPFHGWEFSGGGECVKIPYCNKIPKKGRTKSWKIVEVNGMIFTWYHSEGLDSQFGLPKIEEFQNKKGWAELCELNYPKVRVHIQEVAENALDTAHFNVVHAYYDLPNLLHLEIKDHKFNMIMESRRKVLGILDTTDIEITYHGFGFVHSDVNSKPVKVSVILTTTPVDREHVEIHLSVRYKKSRNPIKNFFIKRIIPGYIDEDFARDFPIWENKLYFERPALCKDDGPIAKIRNWAQQFYGKQESPTSIGYES